MSIEFKEFDKGFHEIYIDEYKTGVEIIVITKGSVILDPLSCAGSFDIDQLEQILAKMKELQEKNK